MKRIALAAMLGLMAFAPAVQADTTVKYLNIASIPGEVALMQDAVKEYEAAHPGVKIELPFLENEAFKAKLTTLLQSSEAPDIFHSWGGGVLTEQAKAGVLRPIEGVISQEAFDRFRKDPLAAGPYRVVDRQAQRFITLEAARKDPLLGCPVYKRIEFRNISEFGTRLAQFRTGQLDIIEGSRDFAASKPSRRVGSPPSSRIIAAPTRAQLKKMITVYWQK